MLLINPTAAVREQANKFFSDLLTQPAADIDVKSLKQVVDLEGEAKGAGWHLIDNGKDLAGRMSSAFMKELAANKELTKEQRKDLENQFGKHVLRHVEETPKSLYENLKKGKGILFYGMANKKVINVLDGILKFKKNIDATYPGLSDMMLGIASIAIKAALVSYAPVTALIFKASGISEIATNFLKTENLEKTTKQLKESLDKYEQDKGLKKIKDEADKSVALSSKEEEERIRKEAKGLLSESLTKPLNEVDKEALKKVFELERRALQLQRNMQKESSPAVARMGSALVVGLEGNKKISERDRKEIREAFGEHVEKNIQEVPKVLYENMQAGKGILFKGLMNDRAVSVLKGITSYKKAIDSRFPGLSDGIIKASSFAITIAVSTFVSPAAGTALKASGIMHIAQDFLKTENLEKTTKQLRAGIIELEKDKRLKEAVKRAEQVVVISEKAEVSPAQFWRIGLSDRALSAMMDDISQTSAYKDFIGGVVKYTDAVIPESQEQISENINAVKKQMLDEMKKNGVPESELSGIEAKIDERFKKVEVKLSESLDKDKTVLEKVIVQQQAAQMLIEESRGLVKDAVKSGVNQDNLEKLVMSAVANEVEKKISGPVKDLQEGMKNSKVKEAVKKEMGEFVRSDVVMSKTTEIIKQAQDKSAERGKS